MTRTMLLTASLLVLSFPERDRTAAAQAAENDPFEFFAPTIQLTPKERARLAAGEVVAKTLPAEGRELGLFTAGPTTATADAVVGSVQDIIDLKKGALVPEIGRFSTPPRLDDVAGLTLDEPDLSAIKRCRTDRCDLKLTPGEVGRLRQAIAAGGDAWAAGVQQEFRRILVERASAFMTQGQRAAPVVPGDAEPVQAFAALMQHSRFLQLRSPQLAAYLQNYPDTGDAPFESFLYWSKELLARKPIVSVTQVTVARGENSQGPEALIATREVFSTRYTSGGLALTVLLRGTGAAVPRYLAYMNRTWVDDIRGFWRPLIEWRVRSQAAKVFSTARERMEDWQK